MGDSLSESIEAALRHCRFGAVILSPAFFAKAWPRRELRALDAREMQSGDTVILPVWHNVDENEVAKHSLSLAERVAVRTTEGIDVVAARLGLALGAAKARAAGASQAARTQHDGVVGIVAGLTSGGARDVSAADVVDISSPRHCELVRDLDEQGLLQVTGSTYPLLASSRVTLTAAGFARAAVLGFIR